MVTCTPCVSAYTVTCLASFEFRTQ